LKKERAKFDALQKLYEDYASIIPKWIINVIYIFILTTSFFTAGLLYYKAAIIDSHTYDVEWFYYIPIVSGSILFLFLVAVGLFVIYKKDNLRKEKIKLDNSPLHYLIPQEFF
jgi:hypothetical protein